MSHIDKDILYDVTMRRNSHFSNLSDLCKDISATSIFTAELHTSNDFYGNAEQLKRFLHLPSHYALKAAIQHGNQYAGRDWDVEANSFLPLRLAWGTHIRDTWSQRSEKETHMISAPFFYTKGLLSENELAAEKKRLGKNLLLFPAHSNHNTTITFDVLCFWRQLEDFVKAFDTVRVCIYWKDYILGLHKPYEDLGLECVTAGHIFDYNFLPRLYSLLETCDASASNRIGSFFGYSIFLGKPHIFFDQALDIHDHGIKRVEEDEVIWRNDPGVQKILEVFSNPGCVITDAHWDCLEPYFGFKEIKTAEQLCQIFYKAEELYQQAQKDNQKHLIPAAGTFEEPAQTAGTSQASDHVTSNIPAEQPEECFDAVAELRSQLHFYQNSKIVQGALQLRDIAKRKAWRELPAWSWRATRFVGKKLLHRPDGNPLIPIECFLAAGDIEEAHKAAYELKRNAPIQGLDALRARIFLHKGDTTSAILALQEELRYFPDNMSARAQLKTLKDDPTLLATGNAELDALLPDILPYTMVESQRLLTLYENAVRICNGSLAGNFVECGVAAGGTSGLLSVALLKHDTSKTRRLFSFDTFSGMPHPASEDAHHGISAQATGWGEGTCAAPEESLWQLANKMGTTHLVTAIKGLFADTLPDAKKTIGPITLLHMDGDWYESTHDILHNLYDQLVPGAYVQIDDYGYWDGCRKAVHEFFHIRGIQVELHPIDGTGVWFTKPEDQIPQDTTSNTHAKSSLLISEAIKTKQELNARVLINLGCGSHWHPDWINIDIHGDNDSVFQHDLRQGVPLPEASADFIYVSHCLEHFTRFDAENFLRQCTRALKPLGTLRISVPDLEQTTRAYLMELDALRIKPDDAEIIARHNWMITELIDQLCRHQSGGEMLKLWTSPEAPSETFLLQRIGAEYLKAHQHLEESEILPLPTDAQQVGTFRLGGEPHQWMYDEFSLSRLLHKCGFTATLRTDAASSRLEGFIQYCLDTNFDGSVYKPDGLYMEAWLV